MAPEIFDTIDGVPKGPINATRFVKTIVPSVAAGTSTILVESNPARIGLVIWNNSGNSCYVSPGPVSIAASCAWILGTYNSLSFVTGFIYTGQLSAIRNSGTGTWTVWEFFK